VCSAQGVEHFLFIAVMCRKSTPDNCRAFPMYAGFVSNGRWPMNKAPMALTANAWADNQEGTIWRMEQVCLGPTKRSGRCHLFRNLQNDEGGSQCGVEILRFSF